MSSLVTLASKEARNSRRREEIASHISPPGALKGLPPLLEQRRHEFKIPDEAFQIQASFKRVYLWQHEPWQGETFGPNSSIVRTDIAEQRGRESTPRAVIVSAGLYAEDCLRSNGMGLGDIVWIIALGVFRLPILTIDARDEILMVLQVGDITGGEDTWLRLQNGSLIKRYDPESHEFLYEWNGELMPKRDPFVPDDM